MESTHLYLFFGGTYSNIHSLEVLKKEAKKLQIPSRNIYHTGDVVGYCAFPNETINLVRDWGINVIAGNVEIQLREGEEDCGCNFDEGSRCADFSNLWYPYAKMKVSSENIEWMKALQMQCIIEINGLRIGIIHGGIDNVSEFIFKSTPSLRKQELISQLNVDVIVAGHCGIPFMEQVGSSYWVNTGVLGMPANDGTSRVWYSIYNSKTETFSSHSLNYDFEMASQEMIKSNLPIEYAKTLMEGLWDNCEILPEEETRVQGKEIFESQMKLERVKVR